MKALHLTMLVVARWVKRHNFQLSSASAFLMLSSRKLLRKLLPLMSFVVAMTMLQLLPGRLLIQRRAAISANVTPPINITSTVLCCLLGTPAEHNLI